jgi:signal transduction histidine kinase
VGNWTIMGTAEEREAFWRTHHEAWQRSTLNQREYCEAHGLVLKRPKFKDEPEVPQKLLYRRGGRPSHMTGHMTVPVADAEAQAAVARRGEQAKSRFLAEVGHELRTPLQAMQGLLDLAAERPEELNLCEIRDVFGSLKSVVDDLTELGALGAEAPLNFRATDLAALLGSELALMQDTARKKGLVLGSDLTTLQERFFNVDPDRVRQVVRNLVSNAVKYTEEGGVTVRGSVAEGVGDKAHVALAVEDTGCVCRKFDSTSTHGTHEVSSWPDDRSAQVDPRRSGVAV